MGFFSSILITDPIAEGEAPPKLISASQNQAEIKSKELKTSISMHSRLAYIHRLLTDGTVLLQTCISIMLASLGQRRVPHKCRNNRLVNKGGYVIENQFRATEQSLLTAQINSRSKENECSFSVSGPENLPFITPQVFLQGLQHCKRRQ